MNRWTLRHTLLLLGFLLLPLSSCSFFGDDTAASDDDDSRDAPDQLAFDDDDPDEEEDDDDPSTAPRPRWADGVVDIAIARPTTVLPAEVPMVEQEAVIVSDLLYDGLTEAVGIEGRLRPGLANDWWANADFTQWNFALDAERLDAIGMTKADVIAYFDELRQDESRSSLSVESIFGGVVSVEAGTASEIVFRLGQPNAGFPWLVSGLAGSVVGPDAEPTGRFVIEKESPTTLELTPRADDGGESEARGVVEWVDRVVFHWNDDASGAYDRLALGAVDAAVASASSIDDAQSRFGAQPPARTVSRFYVLNVDSPRLADPLLQNAVRSAIDRDRIVADALMAPTYGVNGVVAPSAAGYRAPACGPACELDLVAAGEAVSRYVSATGQTPVLRVGFSDDTQRVTAEMIAENLDRSGMDVELVELAADEIAGAVSGGEVDVYAFGWVSAAGSVDAVIPHLFDSTATTNPLGFSDTAVDELLVSAATEDSTAKRWELLADAHDLALQQGMIVPIAVAKSYFIQPPTGNQITVRADGSLDFSR